MPDEAAVGRARRRRGRPGGRGRRRPRPDRASRRPPAPARWPPSRPGRAGRRRPRRAGPAAGAGPTDDRRPALQPRGRRAGTPARGRDGTRRRRPGQPAGPGRSGPRPVAGRRLQPVAAHPQQPDALGHRAQQLDRLPFGDRPPGPTRRCSRSDRSGSGQAGCPHGDAGLGGGQPAVGAKGKPVTLGDQRDQGVQAGEQPAVIGWHGGSLRGTGCRGGRSLPRDLAGLKGAAAICGRTASAPQGSIVTGRPATVWSRAVMVAQPWVGTAAAGE
jgi:hypothetical protein